MVVENGSKHWLLNGQWHREDGTAIEMANCTKCWFLNELKHRVDGPAEEWWDGTKKWWLNGKELKHPESFSTMEEWFVYLNDNESETYQLIHDYNGFIEFINNPSAKQTRVHQMAYVL